MKNNRILIQLFLSLTLSTTLWAGNKFDCTNLSFPKPVEREELPALLKCSDQYTESIINHLIAAKQAVAKLKENRSRIVSVKGIVLLEKRMLEQPPPIDESVFSSFILDVQNQRQVHQKVEAIELIIDDLVGELKNEIKANSNK